MNCLSPEGGVDTVVYGAVADLFSLISLVNRIYGKKYDLSIEYFPNRPIKVVGVIDENRKKGEALCSSLGISYLGGDSSLPLQESPYQIINNVKSIRGARKSVDERLKKVVGEPLGIGYTLKNPGVILSSGVQVYPQVWIDPLVCVGEGVVLLPNSFIGHDSKIEPYSIIGAGVNIGGNTKIGAESFICPGVTVEANATVPQRTVIGANSFFRNKGVEESGWLWVGSPARPVKKINNL